MSRFLFRFDSMNLCETLTKSDLNPVYLCKILNNTCRQFYIPRLDSLEAYCLHHWSNWCFWFGKEGSCTHESCITCKFLMDVPSTCKQILTSEMSRQTKKNVPKKRKLSTQEEVMSFNVPYSELPRFLDDKVVKFCPTINKILTRAKNTVILNSCGELYICDAWLKEGVNHIRHDIPAIIHGVVGNDFENIFEQGLLHWFSVKNQYVGSLKIAQIPQKNVLPITEKDGNCIALEQDFGMTSLYIRGFEKEIYYKRYNTSTTIAAIMKLVGCSQCDCKYEDCWVDAMYQNSWIHPIKKNELVQKAVYALKHWSSNCTWISFTDMDCVDLLDMHLESVVTIDGGLPCLTEPQHFERTIILIKPNGMMGEYLQKITDLVIGVGAVVEDLKYCKTLQKEEIMKMWPKLLSMPEGQETFNYLSGQPVLACKLKCSSLKQIRQMMLDARDDAGQSYVFNIVHACENEAEYLLNESIFFLDKTDLKTQDGNGNGQSLNIQEKTLNQAIRGTSTRGNSVNTDNLDSSCDEACTTKKL